MRVLIIFAICLAACLSAYSQTAKFKLTEKTVVKDSSGTTYPYEIWRALLMKGYTIKPVDPKNSETEFLLIRLTEKQQAERLEKMPKPRESTFFTTGQKMASFKTSDIDGNKIDLKKLEGKIIVINFWFINCQPCRTEIPELNKLVDSFKTNEKIVFLAVALDGRSSLKDFLKKMPFAYTIIDDGRFIADKYGIRSYPTHVIVNTDGKVYFHTTGLAPNTVQWIEKSIKELLAQEAHKTAAN